MVDAMKILDGVEKYDAADVTGGDELLKKIEQKFKDLSTDDLKKVIALATLTRSTQIDGAAKSSCDNWDIH